MPGITSAFAAPALAGIPVTHRGLSAGVLVVSGHAESSYRPLLEMLPPESVTVVVLMGLGESATIASLLVSTGWRSQTPVAVVFAAGTPDAFTWTGTLAALSTPGTRGGASAPRANGAPATIVIGQVVSLADVIGAVFEEKESHVSHG